MDVCQRLDHAGARLPRALIAKAQIHQREFSRIASWLDKVSYEMQPANHLLGLGTGGGSKSDKGVVTVPASQAATA